MNWLHMLFDKDSTYQAAWFRFYKSTDFYLQNYVFNEKHQFFSFEY